MTKNPSTSFKTCFWAKSLVAKGLKIRILRMRMRSVLTLLTTWPIKRWQLRHETDNVFSGIPACFVHVLLNFLCFPLVRAFRYFLTVPKMSLLVLQRRQKNFKLIISLEGGKLPSRSRFNQNFKCAMKHGTACLQNALNTKNNKFPPQSF